MHVAYVTTKSYPATTADHSYVRELALALSRLLKRDFLFVVRKGGAELAGIEVVEQSNTVGGKTFAFFLFLIRSFVTRQRLSKTDWFISNDQYLLIVLGLFRILTFRSYKIIFDAHILSRSWRDSLTLKLSDRIITTSDVLREKVIAVGAANEKVVTVWGGVDQRPYADITEAAIRQLHEVLGITGKKVVGYVGRFRSLGHEKELKVMVEALQFLPEECVCLFVGGTEEEVIQLRQHAAVCGVTDRCVVLELVPATEVALYQKACDVLVIPYPDEPHFREFGFPMKIFEYIAANRPIVYSKLKIMDDLLCEYGYSFTPGQSKTLAQSVETALTTNTPRPSIDFSWQAKAEKIIALMRKGVS